MAEPELPWTVELMDEPPERKRPTYLIWHETTLVRDGWLCDTTTIEAATGKVVGHRRELLRDEEAGDLCK